MLKAKSFATNPEEKDIKARAPEFVSARIIGGHMVISDYSRDDDRDTVLALMAACGVESEAHSESWCG